MEFDGDLDGDAVIDDVAEADADAVSEGELDSEAADEGETDGVSEAEGLSEIDGDAVAEGDSDGVEDSRLRRDGDSPAALTESCSFSINNESSLPSTIPSSPSKRSTM